MRAFASCEADELRSLQVSNRVPSHIAQCCALANAVTSSCSLGYLSKFSIRCRYLLWCIQNTIIYCSFSCIQERYEAASMSWQHPETPYPPAALAALRGSKGAAGLPEQRHAAWQEAFRGLYHALRHRHCDAFYLCTPPVSTNLFLKEKKLLCHCLSLLEPLRVQAALNSSLHQFLRTAIIPACSSTASELTNLLMALSKP